MFTGCLQGELYKDSHPDSNVKVGMTTSEKIDSADKHDGRYSVYSCEFRGRGPAHKVADVQKYGLDDFGSRGSDVSAKAHIEWPENKSGLSRDALAKVRKTILWLAFASGETVWTKWKDDKHPTIYIMPEALGETEQSLLKRAKELWANEGEDRAFDEWGLQPVDWCRLLGDAISRETGRLPARDDGRITTRSLELAIDGIKRCAQDSFKCDPPRLINGYWEHTCSQWIFEADVRLDWPFGIVEKENAKWYERPVLCVRHEGFDRDGGHGVHASFHVKVFSLPDGMESCVEDYFANDKLKNLAEFIWKRYAPENVESDKRRIWEDEAKKNDLPLVDLSELNMQITSEGIKWSWWPDSLGYVPSVFCTWEELTAFK